MFPNTLHEHTNPLGEWRWNIQQRTRSWAGVAETWLGSGGPDNGYGRSRYGDLTTEVPGMAAGGASPVRAQSPYSAEGKREIDGVSEKREKK